MPQVLEEVNYVPDDERILIKYLFLPFLPGLHVAPDVAAVFNAVVCIGKQGVDVPDSVQRPHQHDHRRLGVDELEQCFRLCGIDQNRLAREGLAVVLDPAENLVDAPALPDGFLKSFDIDVPDGLSLDCLRLRKIFRVHSFGFGLLVEEVHLPVDEKTQECVQHPLEKSDEAGSPEDSGIPRMGRFEEMVQEQREDCYDEIDDEDSEDGVADAAVLVECELARGEAESGPDCG